MKLFLKWPCWLVAAAGLMVALAGCSSPTGQRLLHVFFTGVDEPVVTAPVKPIIASSNAPTAAAPVDTGPVKHFHKPYEERRCSACHVSAQSQELLAHDAELCLKCHDKLIGDAKVVHQPVDDGKCLVCHNPHESFEPFLLTHKGRAVCLDCHKMAKLEKKPVHASMGEAACTSCHNPHRSEFKALLLKEWP